MQGNPNSSKRWIGGTHLLYRNTLSFQKWNEFRWGYKNSGGEKLGGCCVRSYVWNYNVWQRGCEFDGWMLALEVIVLGEIQPKKSFVNSMSFHEGKGESPQGMDTRLGEMWAEERERLGRKRPLPLASHTWDHPLILFEDLRSMRVGWHEGQAPLSALSALRVTFFNIFRTCPSNHHSRGFLITTSTWGLLVFSPGLRPWAKRGRISLLFKIYH